MHRRTLDYLLPLDTELERTIMNLRKKRIVAEASVMTDQGVANHNIPVVATDRPQQI